MSEAATENNKCHCDGDTGDHVITARSGTNCPADLACKMSPPVCPQSEADPVVRTGGCLVRPVAGGLSLLKYVVVSRVVLFCCSFVVVTIAVDDVSL